MNCIKKAYLSWQLERDKKFLVSQGMERAKEKGLEINVATEYRMETGEERRGTTYLQPTEEGQVDVTELVALIADDHPERTKRYLRNLELLSS